MGTLCVFKRVKDPTYVKSSELERETEVHKTFWARDEVMQIGALEGPGRESTHSVISSLSCHIGG